MQATNILIHIQWVQPFFPGGVMFVIYLHLAPNLRMSGKIPLPPQYVFMVLTGKIYNFFSSSSQISMKPFPAQEQ